MVPWELCTRRKLARGSLGGACWGCEARGLSRWEGWGDPLTKAMRGRMSPRPGPSCATVFGRGSPHPSGQTPEPSPCLAPPAPRYPIASPASASSASAALRPLSAITLPAGCVAAPQR